MAEPSPPAKPDPAAPDTVEPAPESSPRAEPGAPGHNEWLIDESLAETFPASDPISPAAGPGRTKSDAGDDASPPKG